MKQPTQQEIEAAKAQALASGSTAAVFIGYENGLATYWFPQGFN